MRSLSPLPALGFAAVFCFAPAHAATPPPTLREFIGINGHTVQFKPELYRPVCGLVRDYHPVEWDLAKDPDTLPPFPFAKNRVDWSRVYGGWRAKEWTIDACLMFESVPRETWGEPAALQARARAYGRAFAREFGPSGARKLVESAEIGNEPGKWTDADYAHMFRALAEGLREGDPKLKIATCNLTAGKSGAYDKSVECLGGVPPGLVDVLTVHSYPQLENWPTWRRSFPEDARLPRFLPDIDALCRWRDAHAPGKPVWITEFGYDSSTQPPKPGGDFAKWVGVNDTQQAQWLVRSLLVFSSMPVQRAYIYFFNDEDTPSLHAASGITRRFQPKPAFHALAHFQKTLGDFRFEAIVRNEPGRIRIQEYRDGAGRRVWAVWAPAGEGMSFKETLRGVPGRLVDCQRMPLRAEDDPKANPARQAADGSVEITVEESPAYLAFEVI